MKTLAIIGASGHGKVVADIASACAYWEQVVFYDDAWPQRTTNGKLEIVGNTLSLMRLAEKPSVIVAIGDNKVRLAKLKELSIAGFNIATLIHPSSIVSASAKIEAGTVVMPGAVINADATVGSGCIINSNAVIEHDCFLGDGVHISPGACLAGGVHIGEASWIGLAAAVIQSKRIGCYVTVGAAAAVIEDLPDHVIAVGVPAKII